MLECPSLQVPQLLHALEHVALHMKFPELLKLIYILESGESIVGKVKFQDLISDSWIYKIYYLNTHVLQI